MTDPFPPRPISNAKLASHDVPAPGASWWPDIETFALTFNGSWALGDDACGPFANWVRDTCAKKGVLSSRLSLTGLRSCLFFEQRRYRHFGHKPGDEERPYIDALLARIATLAAKPGGARGAAFRVERHAMEVIEAEERARGHHPKRLSKAQEAIEGCDLLIHSDATHSAVVERVEVKGWGKSLLGSDGGFRYSGDVNREQHARAARDPTWRLEIVANLAAAQACTGRIERLTLTAQEVTDRASPSKYAVRLTGLEDRISSPLE